MREQQIQAMRLRLQDRLTDYLKASSAEYYPPALTVCPCCGGQAGIAADSIWSCTACGKSGDVIDYDMARNGFSEIGDSIRNICRFLNVRITELETISAEELMDTTFAVSKYLVDRLIGKGLYILAGPPKVGKSWLVLWLADRISKGLPVWELKTTKCDVLYMALEDSRERIQQRLNDVSESMPGKIQFATMAESLGNGFEEQLTGFLRQHEQTKLVIVDTLQKIRPPRTEQYSYSADYEMMTTLKNIADRFGITILLVHHTRKEEASDPFNRISGTTGLLGCADGALVLQKGSRQGDQATLNAVSREFADVQLNLSFNHQTKCWDFISYGTVQVAEQPDALLTAVDELIGEKSEWVCTATELYNLIHEKHPQIVLKPNVLSRRLNAKVTELYRRYGIIYTNGKQGDSRCLRFVRCKLNDENSERKEPDDHAEN